MAPDNASSVAASLINNYGGSSDLTRAGIFSAFAALSWYNVIELIILCLVSFRRWNGTYFWSLLIASASIVPYCLGFILLFFPTGVTPWLCTTLIVLGWYGMITGQSVVLWSRLHLVLQNRKIMRGVLCMICVDAVIFHIPTTVVLYGTVARPNSFWARGYDVMERIQLLLRLRPEGRPYGILNQLLVINIIILILDISIVAIEYVGYYAVQVMFKPVAYSIKLKLEYAILGKLVAVARGDYDSQEMHSSAREFNEIASLPSDRDRISNIESPMQTRRQYTPPWLFEGRSSSHSTSTSSGVLRNP
ncbi:unnamed protein product [Penicillium glandicola]